MLQTELEEYIKSQIQLMFQSLENEGYFTTDFRLEIKGKFDKECWKSTAKIKKWNLFVEGNK